jgi:hypothetical protein
MWDTLDVMSISYHNLNVRHPWCDEYLIPQPKCETPLMWWVPHTTTVFATLELFLYLRWISWHIKVVSCFCFVMWYRWELSHLSCCCMMYSYMGHLTFMLWYELLAHIGVVKYLRSILGTFQLEAASHLCVLWGTHQIGHLEMSVILEFGILQQNLNYR